MGFAILPQIFADERRSHLRSSAKICGLNEKLRNHRFEFIEINWLRDVAVAPRADRFRLEVGGVVCGHRDDGRTLTSRNFTDETCGSQTINYRQAEVHQDEVRTFGLSQSNGLLSVHRFHDAIPSYFEQAPHHEAIVFRVFDQ